MTTSCSPARVNAAHEVSPIGGVSLTPAVVTERSLRGTATERLVEALVDLLTNHTVSGNQLAKAAMVAVAPLSPQAEAEAGQELEDHRVVILRSKPTARFPISVRLSWSRWDRIAFAQRAHPVRGKGRSPPFSRQSSPPSFSPMCGQRAFR
jgi:hypothetical protein